MLILDVKTRWSSTHQMLRRALDYRTAVDNFVAKTKDLRMYEMNADDWKYISLVTSWLKSFRSATTQMSTTKHASLSFTHAVFRGLQEEVRKALRELPSSAPSRLKQALIASHQKLSDYYYKFDESYFYVWSSILDPRITLSGLTKDAQTDYDVLAFISTAKDALRAYYDDNYLVSATSASNPPSTPRPSSSACRLPDPSPQKFDFTARYQTEAIVTDEFEEFLKLRRERFATCDPIKWWASRTSQFPHLSALARDIFSIPGSAVAVERIFSGGRDTIALRRASLKSETIQVLMLVKHHLRLARERAVKLVDLIDG